ncbi:MAG: hypothetical protein PGN23_04710 [Sphingomonas adhaesiva]|uniref:hypothetical protein n=1 Tax=Sphingomonas adhaesiva TaxID=28212 RepID=UPI002FF8F7BB
MTIAGQEARSWDAGGWDGRWTKTKRETFLDHLSMTGDVASAAAAAGVPVMAAYAKRRREAGFAAAWQMAAAGAYERLEAAIVAQVLGGGSGIDLKTAMLLLAQRPAPVAPPARPRDDRREAAAALLKQLRAQAKRGGTPEPA